jgi:multidrug efflux pump subunit AcrB
VFSVFENSTPQLYLDIDRQKAQLLGINVSDVFSALQIYLGSSYVNDFNLFGRTFRVTAQANAESRMTTKDVLAIRVRNSSGDTVPLGSFTTVRDTSGPYRWPRYNLYPSRRARWRRGSRLQPGQAMAIMEKLAARDAARRLRLRMDHARLPATARRQHRDLRLRAGSGVRVPGAGGAVRKSHAAHCRHPDRADVSDRVDCRRGAARQDNNILTQVGFIVLIGLAAKNAILIVEFAKQLEDQGRDRIAAAVEAARLRLRPS